ncbi:hypothetical protein [Mesorhizobium sp.]|uniref:hypothetical protein n=1 Tax=Mesorhizobium sp. TaxID=1871066 RepID=UPI00260563EE|nr:hypothetical protein [Mesorhizobium sp.]
MGRLLLRQLFVFAIPDSEPLRISPGIALATPPHDDMWFLADQAMPDPISLKTEEAGAQFTRFAANNVRGSVEAARLSVYNACCVARQGNRSCPGNREAVGRPRAS